MIGGRGVNNEQKSSEVIHGQSLRDHLKTAWISKWEGVS